MKHTLHTTVRIRVNKYVLVFLCHSRNFPHFENALLFICPCTTLFSHDINLALLWHLFMSLCQRPWRSAPRGPDLASPALKARFLRVVCSGTGLYASHCKCIVQYWAFISRTNKSCSLIRSSAISSDHKLRFIKSSKVYKQYKLNHELVE